MSSTTAASGLQCSFCGSDKDLQRCGRCFSVQYCSKEHQKLHWKVHKKACKASTNQTASGQTLEKLIIDTETTSLDSSGPSQSINGNGLGGQTSKQEQGSTVLKKNKKKSKPDTSVGTVSPSETDPLLKELEKDSDNTENRAPDSGPNDNVQMEAVVRGHQFVGANGPIGGYATPSRSFFHKEFSDDPETRKLQISVRVIHDLTKYGVCVIDNLLGVKLGGEVLEEVVRLHNKGAFQDGQVVRECRENGAANSVRGDKITWVEKRDSDCDHITTLIELVDNVIMKACGINNGKLGDYTINGRTKAMIACYPGNGTKYVKHVDNPNKDGRCVTAIYYLNKQWNTKVDGGLLRIFPEALPQTVADIEPLFDRLLFFWSDRRNPHEVQPAFRMRYALTLWYYDSKEKQEADVRSRQSQSIPHFS